MADFSVPFSSTSGDFRFPRTDEYQNGFPCDEADRELFNGLFYQLQSEMLAVFTEGGITPSDTDFTQLKQAILAMISAATGGSPSDYILMTQARARLPIYPEIVSSDGRLNVTSPATGTVRIPSGVDFIHRGIWIETTTEEDFATTANKTYHVRWSYSGGYSLEDLADSGYNSGALAETVSTFDSVFDDMLIARVTTNSSNVATITNLANKARLSLNSVVTGTNMFQSLKNFANAQISQTLDWARTPTSRGFNLVYAGGNSVPNIDSDHGLFSYNHTDGSYTDPLSDYPVTRYNSQFRYMYDGMDTLKMQLSFAA